MITKSQNEMRDREAAILAEMERLHYEQTRLESVYPYLESKPELRPGFLAALAALEVRAGRLDAMLSPFAVRKNVA